MLKIPLLLTIGAMFTLNPLTLSLYPPVSMAPATVRITVLAPRNPGNRLLCWQVDGPEFRKSCRSLDGENAPRVWSVYWNLRTSGEYVAEAVLTRVTEGKTQTYRETQPFRVVGGFDTEP